MEPISSGKSALVCIFVVASVAAPGLAACTSVTTVRLQPETVEVGPNLRPIAGIQANAVSAYLLFIPLPGNVDLDRVVNRMLVVTAKTMGADKVIDLRFDVTPDGGIWALRKLFGWRAAQASGIAVQLTAPAPDPDADQGPEQPDPPRGLPLDDDKRSPGARR